MGTALFLLGVLGIVAGVVLFIVALVRRSGWWVLRSGAIFGAGLLLVIVGIAIGISEEPSEEATLATPTSTATPTPTSKTSTAPTLTLTPIPTPTPKLTPKIVAEDYKIRLYDVGVDKLYIDEVNIVLKNIGGVLVTVTKLIISSNGEEIQSSGSTALGPLEQKEIAFSSWNYGSYDKLAKPIGVDQITATMKILGYPQGITGDQILLEKDIAISIPKVRMGDTIAEIQGKQNLSLTLLSWEKSLIAVYGPYSSSSQYYTFTARPGMKFIVLIYRFQNNGIREQETPYIDAGEIATDKGYIYSVWSPPGGVYSEEYKPREATSEEVDRLIGDSGGYEDLLQEESTIGCVVFEIPADATPVEASLAYVPVLIKF